MLANLFSFGALKSKTVWLGILQLLWTALQTYMAGGTLTPDAIATLITGILTILARAVTTTSLAAKSAPAPTPGP